MFAAFKGDNEFLIVPAFVELAGIFVGVLGLVIVGVVALIKSLRREE